MSPQPYIENPFNQILGQKHGQVRHAVRMALGTVCNVEGKPRVPARSVRRQLKFIQINAQLTGDNIIIPAGQAGVKEILEVVMWNVAGPQDIVFQQGQTGNNPITLLRLTAFPATTGFTLGFNGNFDMPHWEIDNGQPLILNTSNGTEVDGFVRYRVQNGTL